MGDSCASHSVFEMSDTGNVRVDVNLQGSDSDIQCVTYTGDFDVRLLRVGVFDKCISTHGMFDIILTGIIINMTQFKELFAALV